MSAPSRRAPTVLFHRICAARAAAAPRPLRPAAAALAAVLFLASCWHPAFDPEISGSEAVVCKLGAPVLWFTAENVKGWEMEDILFLPRVGSPPQDPGLLVKRETANVRVIPVSFDPISHIGFVDSVYSGEVPNPLAGTYSVHMAPGGNDEAFGMGRYDGGVQFSSLSPPTPSAVDYPSGLGTLGLGFCAIPGSNSATVLWIGYSDVDTPAYYHQNSWTNGAPVFGGPTGITFPDHDLVVTAGTAFELASGHFILSCGLVDGSRAIYRWTTPLSPPVRFSEIYGPLVAALSDGRLLAEKDGILTVLNSDLRRLFSFPAGRLRFVHERWDGGQMVSVFTRAIYVRTSKDDDIGRLKVEVYEIPTADLHKLAD